MTDRPIPRMRIAAAAAAVVVLLPAAAWAGTFDDVPDGAFYTAAVEWAFANGITTGTSPTTFEPDAAVTRGQNVTFAKRYHDNVVAPALDAIDDALEAALAEIAEAEAAVAANQTGIAANETEIDDLRDAAMLHGDVVMVHSTSDMQPLIINLPDAITYWADGTSVSDGFAAKAIDGPSSIGGVDYELHTLEYCIDTPTGDGWVTAVWVWGPGGQLVLDETDRGAAGCWSYTIDAAADGPFSFVVAAADMAGGAVKVEGITTTWRPV